MDGLFVIKIDIFIYIFHIYIAIYLLRSKIAQFQLEYKITTNYKQYFFFVPWQLQLISLVKELNLFGKPVVVVVDVSWVCKKQIDLNLYLYIYIEINLYRLP